ncbi:copper resistance protein NlpE N-terminal domain-containing protein [Psychrobacter sp. AOP22-C1-C5]|uniref:copper resistance protein NlpE N-terminal domain-containing protein n=1 Tax=Psychrobacter sp. AOP22-C1-C5 TaxID=3457716 RepID=UPI0040367727
MIHFAPTYSTMLTVAKSFGCSLLVLPFCAVLIGCDSASSNDNKDMTTKVALTDTLENSDSQNLAQNLQSDSSLQSNDSELGSVEGLSLIAATRASSDTYSSQSSMGAEARSSSSTLQATLMGDYGGIVPCVSCGSIDVTLNLFADGSVSKTSIYNNPESPRAPLLESGIYRQDNDTITIVYEEKKIETYHIQDNHLILMDEEKNPNNDYILSRK